MNMKCHLLTQNRTSSTNAAEPAFHLRVQTAVCLSEIQMLTDTSNRSFQVDINSNVCGASDVNSCNVSVWISQQISKSIQHYLTLYLIQRVIGCPHNYSAPRSLPCREPLVLINWFEAIIKVFLEYMTCVWKAYWSAVMEGGRPGDLWNCSFYSTADDFKLLIRSWAETSHLFCNIGHWSAVVSSFLSFLLWNEVAYLSALKETSASNTIISSFCPDVKLCDVL